LSAFADDQMVFSIRGMLDAILYADKMPIPFSGFFKRVFYY